MADTIEYRRDVPMDLDTFIELYRASTLAERRPADDRRVMERMRDHADLTITAWDGELLVGIARTLTDFGYVAYLADLAVARSHQRRGIGRQLLRETKAALESGCQIVLLAAPAANEYYPAIGFTHQPRAWILPGDGEIH